MKGYRIFQAAAALEIIVGLGLLAVPVFLVNLLIGHGIGQVGIWVARLLAVCLVALGVATWEPAAARPALARRAGLCIFNVGAAITLALAGTAIAHPGILLWPSVIAHGALGVILIWLVLRETDSHIAD